MKRESRVIGGILLVSGTTIGAGMLALPVATGLGGFIPAVFLFTASWLLMSYTGLLLLEVNLWMRRESNLISMAKETLGLKGQVFSWAAYLFLLYSLTTAYLAGSAPIVLDFIFSVTGYNAPEWAGTLPLLGIFGIFVYKGLRSVDRVNRVLMFFLIASYCCLILFLSPHVKIRLLEHFNFKAAVLGISVIATSFGYHIVIPSLTMYLHRDVGKLKKSILVGSSIPLVVYIFWEILTLGIIPLEGQGGLQQGYIQGASGAHLLTFFIDQPLLDVVIRLFSFCAIVTSFLGVSISLSDFLADGLSIKKTTGGRLILYISTFLPPLAFTLIDPRAFLTALEYAGAFGVVSLLGVLPPLMVWSGRYRKNLAKEEDYQVQGGKPALICAIAVSLIIIGFEVMHQLGGLSG